MLLASSTVRASPTQKLQQAPAGLSLPKGIHLAPTRPFKALPNVAMRSRISDDSENMARDDWEGQPLNLSDVKYQEVTFKEQDLKQGNMEGSSPRDQPIGTEMGQEAEQRSGSGAGSGGSEAQEMLSESQGSQADAQGGRFDEEAIPGDHPYDPRPRERGHGVPPHKDSSNTGPGAASSEP